MPNSRYNLLAIFLTERTHGLTTLSVSLKAKYELRDFIVLHLKILLMLPILDFCTTYLVYLGYQNSYGGKAGSYFRSPETFTGCSGHLDPISYREKVSQAAKRKSDRNQEREQERMWRMFVRKPPPREILSTPTFCRCQYFADANNFCRRGHFCWHQYFCLCQCFVGVSPRADLEVINSQLHEEKEEITKPPTE